MELQRVKKELWKHRGKGKKVVIKEKGEAQKMREKLERIVKAREDLKIEEDLERKKKQKVEERIAELKRKHRFEEAEGK